MSRTRLNPTGGAVVRRVVELNNCTCAAGASADIQVTVPTVAGYACLGIYATRTDGTRTTSAANVTHLTEPNWWSDTTQGGTATVAVRNHATSAAKFTLWVYFLFVKN